MVVLLFSLALVHSGAGLYFHLHETENKCFLEEIPSETMIVGEECLSNSTASGSQCKLYHFR